LFFTNLSGFSSFFSVSAKRTDLLRNVCDCSVPKSVDNRWNSHSRVVSNVYDNKDALFECFDPIKEDSSWDDISVRESAGLFRLLRGQEFNFFLSFSNSVFYHVNTRILYSTIQKVSTYVATLSKATEHFEAAIQEIRENLSPPEEPSAKRAHTQTTNLTADAKETCDISPM
jgi:hypothetical protein